MGSPYELTLPAGADEVSAYIWSIDDKVDEPNETIGIGANHIQADGSVSIGEETLTILDDEDAPTVTLALDPASISENGGESRVRARLTHPSSEETTVTVSVTPVDPAVAGDYTLSGSRLRIEAGETTSTGTVTDRVTITAVNNEVDAPDKEVTVTATATNSQGVAGDPAEVTLTITDDEDAPTVTLALGVCRIRCLMTGRRGGFGCGHFIELFCLDRANKPELER